MVIGPVIWRKIKIIWIHPWLGSCAFPHWKQSELPMRIGYLISCIKDSTILIFICICGIIMTACLSNLANFRRWQSTIRITAKGFKPKEAGNGTSSWYFNMSEQNQNCPSNWNRQGIIRSWRTAVVLISWDGKICHRNGVLHLSMLMLLKFAQTYERFISNGDC